MKVLGIDPGTAALGYGIVERIGSRLREVDHGCLTTSPDLSLPERLLAIHSLVDELLALHKPDFMGVERLFFSRNVQTALAVGHARGVVLLAAAQHGAVALVQIDPAGIDLAAIPAGAYDSYLRTYASAVRSYGRRVVLSFGHEMNASWYPWGFGHVAPAIFVAAWRHIVTLFRAVGASNETRLWTVNVTGSSQAAPIAPWWPGVDYVTWVGLDGYFFRSSQTFRSLFGLTIAAVRAITSDPVLIAETGATPAAGKAAKITSMFAGVHRYRLLGFVWFDADTRQDWRVSHDPAAITALRTGAVAYMKAIP